MMPTETVQSCHCRFGTTCGVCRDDLFGKITFNDGFLIAGIIIGVMILLGL